MSAPGRLQTAARGTRRGQRGFTLLELLITLAITTIGMVGVMSLHLSVGRGNEGAARANEAVTVATETVEWLRSMTFPELEAALGVVPALGPDVIVALADVPGRNAMAFRRRAIVRVLSGGPGTRLTRFRVEVGWTEEGAARTLADDFANGAFDHSVAFEFVRTEREFL
ncbi:MAG: prepilin-type N-terminal cleavage/methylation domain-containing protein [Kofleriaceae bacterium]